MGLIKNPRTYKQKKENIKFILSKLEDSNREVFKRMYSPFEDKDINTVVDELPNARVNWALQQCKNSYYKIFKILEGKL